MCLANFQPTSSNSNDLQPPFGIHIVQIIDVTYVENPFASFQAQKLLHSSVTLKDLRPGFVVRSLLHTNALENFKHKRKEA